MPTNNPGIEYPLELKTAVISFLMLGNSPSAASSQFGVPEMTVRGWLAKLKSKDREKITGRKQVVIENLLLDYVEENLTTLTAQTRFFRNEQWLEKQEANSAAILHGVVADKTINILERLGRGARKPAGNETSNAGQVGPDPQAKS